jgi:hypothetical protein
MATEKKVAFIAHARITHIADADPSKREGEEYFILRAMMIVDRPQRDGRVFSVGDEVTTSRLLRIDIEKNEFETKNTIYKIIPSHLIEVYRMTDPNSTPKNPKVNWI